MSDPTPPLTLEQYQSLHLLTEHVGRGVLAGYRQKYEEVRDAWARVFPPGKAVPPAKGASDADKHVMLAFNGDGRTDPKAPRTDWQDFQRRWQHGAASLADLAQQVDQLNDVLVTRKQEPIDRLRKPTPTSERPDAEDTSALAEDVDALRGEVAKLRSGLLELERRLVTLASAPRPVTPNGHSGDGLDVAAP